MNLVLCIKSFLLMEGMKMLAKSEGWEIENGETVAVSGNGRASVLVLYSKGPGWTVLAEETRGFCRAPIVLLTEASNFVKADLDRFGVKAVIPSSATDTEIVTAVNSVALGNSFKDCSISVEAGDGTLTNREREILRALADGSCVKEIAVSLSLSVKTVEAHKFNLMKKLGLHNKAQLTKYAISKGVVQV